MSSKIEIDIDENNLVLYNSLTKSLEYHTKHLDRLAEWTKQLIQLEKLFPSAKNNIPYQELKFLIELNGLVNIVTLDLAVVVQHFYLSKHKWERVFYAKHGLMLIKETINSYDKFNQRFQKILSHNGQEILDSFSTFSKELRAFKRDYASTIDPIRNEVAAHISNFNTYYKIINTVDVMKALVGIQLFLKIINRLQDISATLVNIYNTEVDVNFRQH
ncbi:MAG: hypothetical protein V4553_05630 [Bacteroidota bacterium]